MGYFILHRTFTSWMSITSTLPTFLSGVFLSPVCVVGFRLWPLLGWGSNRCPWLWHNRLPCCLCRIASRLYSAVGLLFPLGSFCRSWMASFWWIVFCFLRVRAGSSCSFLEGELSWISITNQSLITTSFIPPLPQCCTSSYKAIIYCSADSQLCWFLLLKNIRS